MPDGIGFGPDAIQKMVELAIDPTFDTPVPGDIGVLQQGVPQRGGPTPTMDFRTQSFQQGGVVQPQGAPVAGVNPAGNNTPIPLTQMQQEIQRLVQEHPEKVLQIKQGVMQALQNGDITPAALNQALQLATAAAQNPQLWPQLRQFAIRQGLADEKDLPQEYDQGLVFVIILAAKAAQSQLGGQGLPQSAGQPAVNAGGGAPQSAGQPSVGSFQHGGPLPASRNADGSVPVNAHEGEVIIHAGAVKAKGTEFFNKFNDGFELDGSAKEKTKA